ncbi:MAG: hypothetical protein JSV89_22080 [Spirochaetaceae bacterium]|nr:MAG: hypothetical protein JSV89_22080 [Spirochaetaceae bacterium]
MNRRKGRIEDVQPLIEGGRLKVRLRVCKTEGGKLFAFLPDRELSALLPRSILLTTLQEVPRELLETIDPMLSKQVRGRVVRLWQYAERWYASFLPWRSVHFADP